MKYITVGSCLNCFLIRGFPLLRTDGGFLCVHVDAPKEKTYADGKGNMIQGKQISDGTTGLSCEIPPPDWCPLEDMPEALEPVAPSDGIDIPKPSATWGKGIRFQLWIADAENPDWVEVECYKCGEALGNQGIHDFVEHVDCCVPCAVSFGHWPDHGDIPF